MQLELSISEVQARINDILHTVVSICDRNHITYYCQAGTVLGAVRHNGPIPWDYDADIVVPNNEIARFVECCVKELPKEYKVDFHTLGGYNQFPRIGLKGYSTQQLHLDVFQLIGLPNDREAQLAVMREAEQYRNEMKSFRAGARGIAAHIRRGQIKECWHTIVRHCKNDTSFMERMDELCARYPYDQAEYVMNPFGKYREKNIFLKSVYGEGKLVPYSDFEVRIPSEIELYLRQYYNDYMKFPPQEEIDKNMKRVYCVTKLEKN